MLFYKPDLEGVAEKRQMNRLLRALCHWDEEVREEAMDILGELGDTSVIGRLLEMSQYKKLSRGRKEIGLTLARLGSLEAIPIVCGMDFYSWGQGTATLDLARLGVPAVIPLLRFIDDPSTYKKDNTVALGALRWICSAYPCDKELSAYLLQTDGASYAVSFLPDSLCANALVAKPTADKELAAIEYDLSGRRPELFEVYGRPHHVEALRVILLQTKDEQTRGKAIDALRKIYRRAMSADVRETAAKLEGMAISGKQNDHRTMHEDAVYGNVGERWHTDEMYIEHTDTVEAFLRLTE